MRALEVAVRVGEVSLLFTSSRADLMSVPQCSNSSRLLQRNSSSSSSSTCSSNSSSFSSSISSIRGSLRHHSITKTGSPMESNGMDVCWHGHMLSSCMVVQTIALSADGVGCILYIDEI